MSLTENPGALRRCPRPAALYFQTGLDRARQTDRFTTLAKGNTPAAPKEKAAEN